jgi:hypothetical protein
MTTGRAQPWRKEAIMGLTRLLTCLLAVGSLVLAVECMLGIARSADRRPVYAAHHPGAWVGRTVWVRGVAVIYHERLDWDTVTVGIELRDGQRGPALALVKGTAERMEAALRELPLVGRWLMPAQTLHADTPAIYRVRLSRVVWSACSGWYQAVLLDGE